MLQEPTRGYEVQEITRREEATTYPPLCLTLARVTGTMALRALTAVLTKPPNILAKSENLTFSNHTAAAAAAEPWPFRNCKAWPRLSTSQRYATNYHNFYNYK